MGGTPDSWPCTTMLPVGRLQWLSRRRLKPSGPAGVPAGQLNGQRAVGVGSGGLMPRYGRGRVSRCCNPTRCKTVRYHRDGRAGRATTGRLDLRGSGESRAGRETRRANTEPGPRVPHLHALDASVGAEGPRRDLSDLILLEPPGNRHGVRC